MMIDKIKKLARKVWDKIVEWWNALTTDDIDVDEALDYINDVISKLGFMAERSEAGLEDGGPASVASAGP